MCKLISRLSKLEAWEVLNKTTEPLCLTLTFLSYKSHKDVHDYVWPLHLLHGTLHQWCLIIDTIMDWNPPHCATRAV